MRGRRNAFVSPEARSSLHRTSRRSSPEPRLDQASGQPDDSQLAKLALDKAEKPRIDPEFEDVTEGEEVERKEAEVGVGGTESGSAIIRFRSSFQRARREPSGRPSRRSSRPVSVRERRR